MTPSQKRRVDDLLEDAERILSRHGGVGLGVSVLGVRVLGDLGAAKQNIKDAKASWDEWCKYNRGGDVE